MEKRMEVFKNKYKLDIKKYESITEDLLMLYKNIKTYNKFSNHFYKK